MQETDFYEQLLALPDLRIQRVEYSSKRITLFCQLETVQQPCPHCLSLTKEVNQYTAREVRDLDISGRQRGRPCGLVACTNQAIHLSKLQSLFQRIHRVC